MRTGTSIYYVHGVLIVGVFDVEQVCRNGSYHMRGNVYVHFLSPESAVAAYNAINGRFYAKKQVDACDNLLMWAL